MSNIEQGNQAGIERPFDEPPITVESLRRDNASVEANLRRREWELNRARKQLTLVATCSDARIMTPNPTSTVVIRSIAGGRDLTPFRGLLSHDSIQNILILGHHSGNKSVKGDAPEGCGGLGVRKSQLRNRTETKNEVGRWVEEHVSHYDALKVALDKARQAQGLTNKEIVLATQDHLDHTIFPMAAYLKDLTLPKHIRGIDFEAYDPKDLYQEGIPSLPADTFEGTTFDEFMSKYFRFLQAHYMTPYAHDRTGQETQNPRMLMITSDVRPPEVCYPETAGETNRVFVETLARDKFDNGVSIPEVDQKNTIAQAEYPVSHFHNMDTIFIVTGNMTESQKFAQRLLDKHWMTDWKERQGTQVIVGETKAGLLRQTEKF